MNILYMQNSKLNRKKVSDIEEIRKAMSMSNDDKDIKPSDLIHSDDRMELRFGMDKD